MMRSSDRRVPLRLASVWIGAVLALGVWTADAAPVGPPSGWLRLRTTGYLFQSLDAYGVTLDRFGAYQEFDGAVTGLARGTLALRVSGRFADDLELKARTTDRSRLYVGHVEARPVPQVTARLGRQFVQEGATGLTLDGVWVSARPGPRCEIRAWGGAAAPYGRTFDGGNLDNDPAWGLLAAATPVRGVRVGLSGAYRERDGRVVSRLLGAEGQLTRIPHLPGVRASGRAAYDFESEEWDRAEALAQWRPGRALPVFAAQVIDRRPRIDAGSYFVRFLEDEERIRIGRFSVRYDHPSKIGTEIEWLGSFVEERTSTRFGGSILTPYGRAGYSVRLGDAGEENRWFGDVGYTVLPWVRLEAGATLLTYALIEDAPESEERDVTTAYGRARLEPLPGVGVLLEVQNVKSPDFTHDVRFLTGLDLTTSFGASRFGLQPGCCGRTWGGRR